MITCTFTSRDVNFCVKFARARHIRIVNDGRFDRDGRLFNCQLTVVTKVPQCATWTGSVFTNQAWR